MTVRSKIVGGFLFTHRVPEKLNRGIWVSSAFTDSENEGHALFYSVALREGYKRQYTLRIHRTVNGTYLTGDLLQHSGTVFHLLSIAADKLTQNGGTTVLSMMTESMPLLLGSRAL